jgi:hypothetical protein
LTILKDLIESQQGIIVSIRRVRVKFGFNVGLYEKFNDSRDRNNAQSPIRAMYDYNPYEPFYARDAAT